MSVKLENIIALVKDGLEIDAAAFTYGILSDITVYDIERYIDTSSNGEINEESRQSYENAFSLLEKLPTLANGKVYENALKSVVDTVLYVCFIKRIAENTGDSRVIEDANIYCNIIFYQNETILNFVEMFKVDYPNVKNSANIEILNNSATEGGWWNGGARPGQDVLVRRGAKGRVAEGRKGHSSSTDEVKTVAAGTFLSIGRAIGVISAGVCVGCACFTALNPYGLVAVGLGSLIFIPTVGKQVNDVVAGKSFEPEKVVIGLLTGPVVGGLAAGALQFAFTSEGKKLVAGAMEAQAHDAARLNNGTSLFKESVAAVKRYWLQHTGGLKAALKTACNIPQRQARRAAIAQYISNFEVAFFTGTAGQPSVLDQFQRTRNQLNKNLQNTQGGVIADLRALFKIEDTVPDIRAIANAKFTEMENHLRKYDQNWLVQLTIEMQRAIGDEMINVSTLPFGNPNFEAFNKLRLAGTGPFNAFARVTVPAPSAAPAKGGMRPADAGASAPRQTRSKAASAAESKPAEASKPAAAEAKSAAAEANVDENDNNAAGSNNNSDENENNAEGNNNAAAETKGNNTANQTA